MPWPLFQARSGDISLRCSFEVVMALTSDETERLFARLKSEGVHLFYVKAAVEFGSMGEPDA
jgi:hypothetical protein